MIHRPHHSADVVQLVPSALRTAFTLREFGRLLAAAHLEEALGCEPVARAKAAVAAARAARGYIDPVPRADNEIPDPYGASPEAHHYTAALIAASLREIVGLFRSQ